MQDRQPPPSPTPVHLDRGRSASRVSRPLHLTLHLVTAALLGVAAGMLGNRPELAVHWWRWQKPLLALAATLALLGAWPPQAALSRLSRRACVVGITVILAVGALELFFRALGHDFRRQTARLRQLPPFYLRPDVPCGTVFFRRPGPMSWTGQPVRAALRAQGLDAAAYADEPVIEVRYDAQGFRNPPNLRAWEMAVAGDSFTELGHLPEEDLFTTLLGRRLGWQVRNLGVSNTGPLSHLTYLAQFGHSPATRHWVVVFYEGNDLADLWIERAAERRIQTTGQRPHRKPVPQTSLLRAWGEAWRARFAAPPPPPPRIPVEAYFLGATGRVAVTLSPPPPVWAEVDPETRAALEDFLTRFAALARERKAQPWLVFMPVKQRVWHGRLEFTAEADPATVHWKPTDLPVALADLCARHDIGFVDLTPALVADTRQHGKPLFNTLFDTHLNARGSRVVAAELARVLARFPF